MKRVVLIGGGIIAFSLGAYGAWWYLGTPALFETEITVDNTPPPVSEESTDTPMIDTRFGTEPMIIGTTPVLASIADEQPERVQGLSGVPGMLPNEVKLFVFPRDDTWGFWMKDMLFSIDMMWVDASSTIVYIEEDVSPETFPTSFKPPRPARYVIETVAGFSKAHNISAGDTVTLPE